MNKNERSIEVVDEAADFFLIPKGLFLPEMPGFSPKGLAIPRFRMVK